MRSLPRIAGQSPASARRCPGLTPTSSGGVTVMLGNLYHLLGEAQPWKQRWGSRNQPPLNPQTGQGEPQREQVSLEGHSGGGGGRPTQHRLPQPLVSDTHQPSGQTCPPPPLSGSGFWQPDLWSLESSIPAPLILFSPRGQQGGEDTLAW